MRATPRLLAASLVLLSMLGGCSNDSPDDANAPSPERQKELLIGEECKDARPAKLTVVAPLTGRNAALGQGIRNSVDLAVRKANHDCRIDGRRLVLDVRDDGGSPDTAAQLAAEIAADPDVVGVVGTVDDAVAARLTAALAEHGVSVVSPANSSDNLTRGTDPAKPTRPHATFFRLPVRASQQGRLAAEHARSSMKVDVALVLDDGQPYGKDLAEGFARRFSEDGGRVVARQVVDAKTDLTNAIGLKLHEANMAFFGGEPTTAASMRMELQRANVKAPLFGGDRLLASGYAETTRRIGEGDMCTWPSAPVEMLDGGEDFAETYRAASFTESYSEFGALAYDAATVLLEAAADVVEGDRPIDRSVRDKLRDRIGKSTVDGVTGDIRFDEFGDNTGAVGAVYRLRAGKWAPEAVVPLSRA